MKIGAELLQMVDECAIAAIKYAKVGDFQGLFLSTLSKSNLYINPNISEAKKFRSWYNCEGKNTKISSTTYDRVMLSHIINDPTLDHNKSAVFSMFAYITYIKCQKLRYQACKSCKKKGN